MIDAIVGDYAAGIPLYAVAAKHGIRQETARRHLVRAGATIRPPKISIPDDSLDAAHQLRQDGWSYRAIGERYGCSRTAVANALAKFIQAAELPDPGRGSASNG